MSDHATQSIVVNQQPLPNSVNFRNAFDLNPVPETDPANPAVALSWVPVLSVQSKQSGDSTSVLWALRCENDTRNCFRAPVADVRYHGVTRERSEERFGAASMALSSQQRRPCGIGCERGRANHPLVASRQIDRVDARPAVGTLRLAEEHEEAAVRRPGRPFVVVAFR